MGEDQTYGMGLMVDKTHGVTMVHHGGMGVGYLSDMFWVPEAGVGGVILTNGNQGGTVCASFLRRVLEVLYDGEPEAEEDVASSIERHQKLIETVRKQLVVPADETEARKLVGPYSIPGVGQITVSRRGQDTVFGFGEWQSKMASRKNDDGSVSFVTIDPGSGRFEFVVGQSGGNPTLTIRDPQHEYVFLAKRQ